MKTRKMIVVISVFTMMTSLVIGGSGSLYAEDYFKQNDLEKIETLVAEMQLTDVQKDKIAELKSILNAKTVQPEKSEKNMDFVNKLTTVMSF